jgi:hypothetical protein
MKDHLDSNVLNLTGSDLLIIKRKRDRQLICEKVACPLFLISEVSEICL